MTDPGRQVKPPPLRWGTIPFLSSELPPPPSLLSQASWRERQGRQGGEVEGAGTPALFSLLPQCVRLSACCAMPHEDTT